MVGVMKDVMKTGERMKIRISYMQTPAGELILGSTDSALCLCDWRYRKMRTAIDQRIQKHLKGVFEEGSSDIITEAERQLGEYFSGDRKIFDLPLIFAGTDFQKRVWQYLQTIPYGETRSYLDLAEALGDRNSVRAAASANGANALSIIVPCHRVIGSDGTMVGYAGGLSAKRKLLELEQPQLKLL